MMTRSAAHERATKPEDLSRFFLERANAGDVEGLVALYQPDAVLAFPPGQITVGRAAIREVYQRLLSTRPTFTSQGQRPALHNGDLALTSTRLPGGGATVEVARLQPDGTWLWVWTSRTSSDSWVLQLPGHALSCSGATGIVTLRCQRASNRWDQIWPPPHNQTPSADLARQAS